MLRHLLIVLATATALAALAAPALAQQTPTPIPVPTSDCANAPISYERIRDILARPVATPAPRPPELASPIPGLLPPGKPADDATASEIHRRILILTACTNAGDLLRTLALYSDQFLSETFAGQPISQAAYQSEVGKTHPRPAGSALVLYGFSDVVIVADGRAVVSVLSADPSTGQPPSYTLVYFVHEAGEWRIDGTYDVGTNPMGQARSIWFA